MRFARPAPVLLATLAASGCASANVVRLADTVPSKSNTPLSSNRQAAARDAAKLLGRVRLPAGATRLSAEPPGDHGWLKPLGSIVGSSARADTHAWWSVPGAPGPVLKYVETHHPSGATRFETGSGGDRSGTTEWEVGYRWPVIAGMLTARVLQVTVTAIPGHGTGVLAQAQSDWFVPRPAAERVPTGVHTIELNEGPIAKPPTLTRSFTNAAQISRITSLIDGMPVVQPDMLGCPALIFSGARVVTLKFDGPGSTALAVARYLDYPPLNSLSGECTPVDFSVHGRQQTPLIGGRFVQWLENITAIRLTS